MVATYLSPLSSDIHILNDSSFLGILEPFDQVMAGRGFKIKTELVKKQCTLAIPPSAAIGAQMLSNDVKETSNIANVRIYIEQAIGRLKDFRIIETPAVFITFANNEKYNACLCCIDKFKEASGFLKLGAYVFYKKHFYKKMSLKNPKTSQKC